MNRLRDIKGGCWVKVKAFTSGQDGGVGKNASPPQATTERISTRFQNT